MYLLLIISITFNTHLYLFISLCCCNNQIPPLGINKGVYFISSGYNWNNIKKWEHQWQACLCYLDFTKNTSKSKCTAVQQKYVLCGLHLSIITVKGYNFYMSNTFRQVTKKTYLAQTALRFAPVTVVSSWGTQPGGDEGNQNPSESPQSHPEEAPLC